MKWVDSLTRSAIVKSDRDVALVWENFGPLVSWVKGNNTAVDKELKRTASKLNIPADTVESELLRYFDRAVFPNGNSPANRFGLENPITEKCIKNRYRSLVGIYHPDKPYFDHIGIDLNDRTESINKHSVYLLNELKSFTATNSSSVNGNNAEEKNFTSKKNRDRKTKSSTNSKRSHSEKSDGAVNPIFFQVDVLKKRVFGISMLVVIFILILFGLVAFSAYSESFSSDVIQPEKVKEYVQGTNSINKFYIDSRKKGLLF